MNPTKTYPDGTAGNYLCFCVPCDRHFVGHKRDPICGECEEQRTKDRIEKVKAESLKQVINELTKQNLELTKENAALKGQVAAMLYMRSMLSELLKPTMRLLETVNYRAIDRNNPFRVDVQKEMERLRTMTEGQ